MRRLVQPGVKPAEAQLLLRRRNTAMLADSFGSAGFEVVIDDVIVWPGGLDLYLDLLRSRPVGSWYWPRGWMWSPCAMQDATSISSSLWRHLNEDLERWTDQPGLRVDTSEQDTAQTAWTIRQRWDKAVVAG